MDESAGYVLDVVLAAAGAQVALGVVISLQIAIHSLGDSKAANVELAVLVEQRPLAVLLNDVAALLAVDVRVGHDLLYLA